LDTIGGVITEMGRVYRQMRRQQLDSLEGSRLVNALTALRQALEMGDLERRMEALESGQSVGWQRESEDGEEQWPGHC
jgi:hypothetical protein